MRILTAGSMMKTGLAWVLALGVTVAACRGGKSVNRKDQKYDVVEEGSAAGVSSTISGPGETQPPSMSTPLTATNADTTSNFALPTTTAQPTAQPGAVPPNIGTPVSQYPAAYPAPATAPATTTRAPRPRPRPEEPAHTTAPIATDTVTVTQPPREHEQRQPPAHTDTQAPPPPQTDTEAPPP